MSESERAGSTLPPAEVSSPGRSLADASSRQFIVYIHATPNSLYASAMYCAYEYVKRDVREKARFGREREI